LAYAEKDKKGDGQGICSTFPHAQSRVAKKYGHSEIHPKYMTTVAKSMLMALGRGVLVMRKSSLEGKQHRVQQRYKILFE
jgi:hypothetical protein